MHAGSMTGAYGAEHGDGRAPVGLLTVQVVRREMAARDVVTLWLAQPGTQLAPAPYRPGQFITLALPSASDTLYRSYSLCGYGRADSPWEITVKRQHAGAVSTFLYEHAAPGMLLYAREPRGAFTLPERITPDLSLVFVAAGSGIAPVYGMLRALAHLPESQRPRAALHYASNSPADVIYARELAALDPQGRWLRQWHYLTSQGERLTPDLALARMGAAAATSEWYFCGPEALKRTMQGALIHHGVPAHQVHVEVFGNQDERVTSYSQPLPHDQAQRQEHRRETGGARVARLRLADSGMVLDVRAGETLLAALERQGYHPDASCRVGSCGTCRIRLLAGRVATDAADADGLTADERAAGYVLTCVARPLGDVTLAMGGRASREAAFARSMRADAGGGSRGAGKVALRVGMVAASLALFGGAWSLTNSSPFAAAGGQSASPTPLPKGDHQTGQPGASGITATPVPFAPNTTTGVS